MLHMDVTTRSEMAPCCFVRRLDGTSYLEASYALRFEVYCREKRFLSPADCPGGVDIDEYDASAVHLGIFGLNDQMVGTVRLVLSDVLDFPLRRHCHYALDNIEHTSAVKVAEISRLAVSKRLLPQFIKQASAWSRDRFDVSPVAAGQATVRVERLLVLELYKALYQESKKQGVTHWLAAMEPSLARLLWRFRFLFRPIGPEVDYYGSVRPYLARINQVEKLVFDANPSLFAHFVEGLDNTQRPLQARQ